MKIEHWVEWLTPGAFFPEEAHREIETRDLAKLQIPRDVYAFQFYDKKIQTAMDEEGNERRIVDIVNKSSRYVIGKIGMLRGEKAIECHLGNWQPLLEGDVVLPKKDLQWREPVIYRDSDPSKR